MAENGLNACFGDISAGLLKHLQYAPPYCVATIVASRGLGFLIFIGYSSIFKYENIIFPPSATARGP